jgi:hypothetical protein
MNSTTRTNSLLPDPLGPTIAVVCPDLRRRLKSCRTLTSWRDGYAKLTLFNSRSQSIETSAPCRPVVVGFGASMILKNMDAALRALDAAAKGTEMALRCAIMVMTDSRTLGCVRLSRSRSGMNLHNQRFDVCKL